MITKNSYHFSVDDVFDTLIEISNQKIQLFEQPFLKFLKNIHQEFDANIGLYLFYQKRIANKLKTLKDIPDLKKQLNDEEWLFFGPHALEYETPPYAQSIDEQIDAFEKIYKEIDRFAGKSTYIKYLRLQHYSESFELRDYFKAKGVEALFSTDREVGSHRMPKEIADKLNEKGCAEYKGMNFIRTQFRVEFFLEESVTEDEILIRMNNALEKFGFVVFYTHEVDMLKQKNRKMAKLMFKVCRKLNLTSVDKP